jgi:hypothetical protein
VFCGAAGLFLRVKVALARRAHCETGEIDFTKFVVSAAGMRVGERAEMPQHC